MGNDWGPVIVFLLVLQLLAGLTFLLLVAAMRKTIKWAQELVRELGPERVVELIEQAIDAWRYGR